MKILVIYNQASGRRRRARLLPLVAKKLKRAGHQAIFLNFENFLIQKDNFANFKYDRVLVCGGDGTIRRVAEFLLQNNHAIPLGIIPIGSANVLAQSLHVPRTIHKALKVFLTGGVKKIDVGLINQQHYFLDAFAIGYLSERILAAKQQLKHLFGFIGYLASFIFSRAMPQYIFNFSVDGQEYKSKGNSLFIVNTTRLFGFEAKRPNDMQDGKFELTVATNRDFKSFAMATYYYYFHNLPPKHLLIAPGSIFNIQLTSDHRIQIDGDLLEISEAILNIQIIRQCLSVITRHHVKLC